MMYTSSSLKYSLLFLLAALVGCGACHEAESPDPQLKGLYNRKIFVEGATNSQPDCKSIELSINRAIVIDSQHAQIQFALINKGLHLQGLTDSGMVLCGIEEIQENGTSRIDSFQVWEEQNTNLSGKSFELILDHSGSMGIERAKLLQEAYNRFIVRKRSIDEVGAIKFDDKISSIQSLSINPVPILIEGLEGFGGYTALYDAIARGVEALEKSKLTYKSIIVFTDGAENSSKKISDYNRLIELARQSNIIVNIVGYNLADDNASTMLNIARNTGGEYFSIWNRNQFDSIFNDIYQRSLNYYAVNIEVDPLERSRLFALTYCCDSRKTIDTVRVDFRKPCINCVYSVAPNGIEPPQREVSRDTNVPIPSFVKNLGGPVECSRLARIDVGNTLLWNDSNAFVSFALLDSYNNHITDMKAHGFRVCKIVDSINGKEVYPKWFSERNEENDTSSVAIMFVLDHSGSMGNDRANAVQRAFNEFIGNSRVGTIAVGAIKFDNRIGIERYLSERKTQLPLTGLKGYEGKTALWDATMRGVQALSNVSYKRKAVILITDGVDNSSTQASAKAIIDSARTNGIAIYPISYGVNVNIPALDSIAVLTGGILRRIFEIREISSAFRDVYVRYLNHYAFELSLSGRGIHKLLITACCDSPSFMFTTETRIYGGALYNNPDVAIVPSNDTIKIESNHFDGLFRYNSSIITDTAGLNSTMSYLRRDSLLHVRLYAFSSPTGPREYNYNLSVQRAEAVKNYLIRRGISRLRIEAYGCGATCPIRSGESPHKIIEKQSRRFMLLYSKGISGTIEKVCPECLLERRQRERR